MDTTTPLHDMTQPLHDMALSSYDTYLYVALSFTHFRLMLALITICNVFSNDLRVRKRCPIHFSTSPIRKNLLVFPQFVLERLSHSIECGRVAQLGCIVEFG